MVDSSWLEISQAELLESEDEDIFARIDLDAISDPPPKLIHLDCNSSSSYNDWATSEKCFTDVFSVDEVCFHDPDLIPDVFLKARQSILEMKLLGQNQQSTRLSVTHLLHYVYNELDELSSVEKELEIIRSLLDDKKFTPSGQDNKQYMHGYFEWKMLLALISLKRGKAADQVKNLCAELVAYSINMMGDSDLRHISPFPCQCFEAIWRVLMTMLEHISGDLNIWSILELSLQTADNNTDALRAKGRKYRDSSLTHLWFLRHFPQCMKSHFETQLMEYPEIISHAFTTFLERHPPESDLRLALYEMKIISRTHRLNVDSLILLWETLYKRINENFKNINLDSTNTMLVPNDTAVSYLNKIRSMVINTEVDNVNLTSYELFLEILIQAWQQASAENDVKYQQKLSNRILLKFSSKMWLHLNEMGIHNLINLLLVFYYLGCTRSLDRIENVLLTVPFPEMTHNRRVAVFKGLTAVLVMFYGKGQERKDKSYPESFVKKFENSIGVDRFTGRQVVYALDTICSSSERLSNKEYAIINPWMKVYLNVCTDNDRDVLLDTLTRIMEKYCRLKLANSTTDESEEVIKRIYQSLEGNISSYLNAEQEVDISVFVANLLVSLKQPIQGVSLVDTLFTNLILNNVRNPRVQFKIANKLAELMDPELPVIHANNLIKAFIKFLLIIDGPVLDLQPMLSLVEKSSEFTSFCRMDCDEFISSSKPFTVFLKGIRSAFEGVATDADRERFQNRFEMYFQMYTKWYLPYLTEDALRCYTNTTAMIYACGRIMYGKRSCNMFKSLINDFYLTSALLGRKAQPSVVIKAIAAIMHTLLGGIFKLIEAEAGDEYLNSVICDLIFHWTPQLTSELNAPGAVAPYLKFTRFKAGSPCPGVLLDLMSKTLLTPNLQRDVLAVRLFREMLSQSKGDTQLVKILFLGTLPRILEYYCKCEDFAPVKKAILEYLENISTLSFLAENIELSRVLDDIFESWTMNMLFVQSSNYFELAIKLARLFPVNLRMIMPKVREEISKRDGQIGSYIAADRLHQKLRNLEMILQQK